MKAEAASNDDAEIGGFKEAQVMVTHTPDLTFMSIRLADGKFAALRMDQSETQDLGCRLLAAAINAKAGKRGCV